MADGGQAKYRPYSAYKPSGVAWLGHIPEGWGVAALKHSVSVPITDGPHETPHFIDEGIPFVSAEAVSSGHIDFNKIRSHISQKDHDRYSQKYLPAFGDIYLVKSGATTGITTIVETDEVFNIWSPLAAIRCNDEMVPKFILHFLRSAQFQEAIRLYWSFGTQQNIGMKVIENLQTAVPCKHEQTKIAAFLDHETAKIDGLIAKQQRFIALLEEKRQAVISHAVTKGLDPTAPLRPSGIDWLGDVPAHWEVKHGKHLFEFVTSGSRGWAKYYSDDGALFFRITNLTRDTIRPKLKSLQYVTPPRGSEGERSKIALGDLLISITADLGSVCVADEDLEGGYVSQHVALCRPNGEVFSADWFGYTILSDASKFQLLESGYGGTKVQLSLPDLKELIVAKPPEFEQIQIADFLDRKLKHFADVLNRATDQITLLKERRTALISAAVTGKIDLRDWQAPEGATDISSQDIDQNEEALA